MSLIDPNGRRTRGQAPWKGIGVEATPTMTAHDLMVAAKLDWEVEVVPLSYQFGNATIESSARAVIRKTDGKELTAATAGWKPTQNRIAFDFIEEFIQRGQMKIDSAGQLDGGTIVWAMAKVDNSFVIFDNDRITGFLLFTIFHRYGRATDIRFVPTREFCMNTLSLESKDLVVKLNHKTTFDPAIVRRALAFAEQEMIHYRNTAQLLGDTVARSDDVLTYFRRIFPQAGKRLEPNRLSRAAQLAVAAMVTQPGSEVRQGTWWQAFNAVTYVIDHQIGSTDQIRLYNAWYGPYRQKKIEALDLAAQMAEAA